KIQAPTPGATETNTVVIAVGSDFFDNLLGAVFRDLGPPAFHLADSTADGPFATVKPIAFQERGNNTITVILEGSNNKTGVQFSNGRIIAPLVFNGSYNLLGNCMQFKGSTQTSIELRFDQKSQGVYGEVNVEGVDLEGVNPIANNFVTVFVRNAIDQRINPLELIRGEQLQLMIPVKASNGAVKAHVKDVRSEITDGQLKLHITYEFSGARAGG